MFVGIDVGAKKLHCVTLDDDLHVLDSWIQAPDPDLLAEKLNGACVVAVDAPEVLSTALHIDDEELSPKFRSARCAEIALGRDHKIWVPWVTPVEGAHLPPWMEVGFRVFDVTKRVAERAIEVYPHAGYRVLAGSRIPSKSTGEGTNIRAELLRKRGVEVGGLEMWSHDALDACLASIIAHDADAGGATKVTCAHDNSAIWLPSLKVEETG